MARRRNSASVARGAGLIAASFQAARQQGVERRLAFAHRQRRARGYVAGLGLCQAGGGRQPRIKPIVERRTAPARLLFFVGVRVNMLFCSANAPLKGGQVCNRLPADYPDSDCRRPPRILLAGTVGAAFSVVFSPPEISSK